MAYDFTDALFECGDALDPSTFWVLMTICKFARQEDGNAMIGKCWPSLKLIAEKAHVSDKIARKCLKGLEERGLVRMEQKAGCKRFFFVDLKAIRALGEPLDNSTPLANVHPLADLPGGEDSHPLANVQGDPLQILQGTPCRSSTRINKEQVKEQEKVLLRPIPDLAAKAAPRPQAGTACTSGPDAFEESLYAEADLWAEEHAVVDDPDEVPPAEYLPPPAQAPEKVEAAHQHEASKTKFPICPYERIVELYHETCPMLPRVMVISSARKRSMKTRWTELCAEDDYRTQAEGLEAMKTFFEIVAKSRFLTGRCDPGYGRTRPFLADLDWLMKPTNFIKVCEGKYTNAHA